MVSADPSLGVHCLYGGVIVNGVAVARGQYADWIGLTALLPLVLLLVTGLYMFALPYATKWRRCALDRKKGNKSDRQHSF